MPLENSIISSDVVDNIACTKQYFTADEKEDGKVRVYMEVHSDSRWIDAHSTLLLLGPCAKKSNESLIRVLVGEGYAVGVIDFCATRSPEDGMSQFPPSLAYATIPTCKKYLNVINDSAHNTPWFVWSKIARRAINVLEQQPIINTKRIGIIGIGEGAHVAWQVAAMDSRIHALVAIGDTGYRWAKNQPRFVGGNALSSDRERAFSIGVGAETYARLVHCPTFLVTARTTRYTDVDRAGDILASVNAENKQLLITGGADTQITKSALGVLLHWLRESFAINGEKPCSPTASFENVSGQLYLRVDTDAEIANTDVYVCYGEESSSARHWDKLSDLQKVDASVYTVGIPVYDVNELIVAHATISYPDSNSISTPIQAVFPHSIGITASDALRESSHIIYDNSMGLGSFACLTKDTVIDEDAITLEKGPFDIEGITTKRGGLLLCRRISEIKTLDRTAILHFDAYSPVERELRINMYTYPEMVKYTAVILLRGGEFWQKILLQSGDFKSENGKPLAEFGDTKILAMSSVEGILFNNFLWI